MGELAHVAPPGLREQAGLALRRYRQPLQPVPRGDLREQVAGERQDVGAAVAQRRKRDPQEVQAMEKVLAKHALPHEVIEGAVAGGDHSDIHRDLARAAEPADVALLDGGQDLGLRRQGQRAHLIEEQRAAVGGLKEADPGPLRVGERPALVPEELRLGEGVGQRRAVQGDERFSLPGPLAMQPAGENALSRPGFALDEDGRQPVLEAALGRDNGVELRAHTPEALSEKHLVGGRAGLRGAMLGAASGDALAAAPGEGERQFLGFERLGQVVARAQADGLDGLLDAAEGRHHDDAGVLRERALAQQAQHLAVRQVQVHQREFEPKVAQLPPGVLEAARLGAQLPQIRGEALAERRIVLEQENLAARR